MNIHIKCIAEPGDDRNARTGPSGFQIDLAICLRQPGADYYTLLLCFLLAVQSSQRVAAYAQSSRRVAAYAVGDACSCFCIFIAILPRMGSTLEGQVLGSCGLTRMLCNAVLATSCGDTCDQRHQGMRGAAFPALSCSLARQNI